MKTFSVKVDDESVELFEKIVEQVKDTKGENYTRGAVLEDVINAFANPKVKTVKEDKPETLELVKSLEKRVAELDEEVKNNMQIISRDAQVFSNLMEVLSVENVESIIPEIQNTQRRAMTVPTEVEVQRPLAEDEILFSIPQPHLALLKETVVRLSSDTKQVTMKDVLLDMFVRYTVEQNAEWFYPFVIKQPDFESITGYTQKQLQQWLNKK